MSYSGTVKILLPKAYKGSQQIRGKGPPFLHPLIKSDKISTHNTATSKHLIDCKKEWVEHPCVLQLSPR